MIKNQTRLKIFGGKKTLGLASRILFTLTLFILLGLANSSVWAYEQDRKTFGEASLMDFPKQAAAAPFSTNPLQRKGYIFGIKTNFEVNTIWSKPKNKLNSDQLNNKYFGGNDFSYEFRNEFPLDIENPVGAKPAKLLEIRF